MIAHEKGFKFHAHILARILVTFQLRVLKV